MRKEVLIILTGLCLVSCSQKEQAPAGLETVSVTVSAGEAELSLAVTWTEESAAELTSSELPSEEAEPTSLRESPSAVGIVNPMKQVGSSADFAEIGLKLEMPPHDTWYRDEKYFVIDGKVAEINFYDNITDSSATVRAADEGLGDVSGIYYNFDDAQNQTWTVDVGSGEQMEILVQVLIDGSDIPGAMASWNDQGVNYFLWEDNGKNSPESVAKLAIEIAKASR